MSSDYSSYERDYFRRPKRREDVKSSKISPKQIKVYEPKSAQKSIKTQGYADDSEQPSGYEHNYYLNYTQSAKKKNERSYAYQARSSSGKEQRGSNKLKALRKDEEMNQDTEEPHKDKTFKHDIIWVPASKTKIPSPLAERSGVDNKSNPPALSPEVEHPLWEDSLMRSPGQSTAATLNNSKSMELFNFSQDRPDPIQILKASLKKERQKKVDIVSESPENAAGNKEEKRLEKDHQGEIEENDGTNYSDIDNLVEEKLLNNQAELDLQDDVSNHLELEQKEVYLEDLENKERPVWEDIDTQQVLEDIKTSNSLELFSQQTILPTKIKSAEVPQSDNFDYFFSFEIREEPMAVEPDIFNFSMKFSSDKQPRAKHLQNDNSLCSQSFDMELIDRRKNHYKPLPAFRNFCIQKGTSDENASNEPKNYSLPIDLSPNNTSPNNMNFPPQIFCNLIPNTHVKVWFYLDLESILQGPFSSQVMDGWYSKGYLPLNLDITIKNGRSFRKIKDLMEIVLSQRCAGYLPLLSTQNRNLRHTPKVYQNDMDLDETEKEINNSIENIISENCCPNVRRTVRQNSAPETLKAFSDRSQAPLSKNQSQGFDNRFSYNNATYLRNLPR